MPGSYFPEGVSSPAPLPPKTLLGNMLLSCLFTQFFFAAFILSSDVEDVKVKHSSESVSY